MLRRITRFVFEVALDKIKIMLEISIECCNQDYKSKIGDQAFSLNLYLPSF